MPRAAPALLLALLPPLLLPGGAGAQTGLLVVGGGDASGVTAAIAWAHGPVWSVERGPQGCGDAVARGLAALEGGGVLRLVVVPLLAPGDAACPTGRHEGARPAVVVPGVRTGIRTGVPTGGANRRDDPATLARRVRDRALQGLLELAAEGLPPGEPVHHLSAIAVTASRTPLELFGTAAPVSVVGQRELDRRGAGPLEAVAELPGVELDGVGVLRRQPVIRGFTGQRVLVLEDGLRLANSRRRLGSVEPAGLVGAGTVERVEVVRGPASVLYGSDAIGGVINLVTRGAPVSARGLTGSVRAHGSTAGDAARATVDLSGGVGGVGVRASGSVRSAGAYHAPAGVFGEVRLPRAAEVHDTGVRDRDARLELAVAGEDGGRLFVRGEAYTAEESGFGWIDPVLLGDDPTRVRLTFPEHRYRRVSAGWQGWRPGLPGMETVDVAVYGQDNRRDFVTDVLAPLGPRAPPDARLHVTTENHTDLRTVGLRWEATTRPAGAHLLTWGVEAYRDRSRGHDTTTVVLTGLGPPTTTVRGDEAVPDATLTSVGVFFQDRWAPATGTDVTAGVRWQDVRAHPEEGDSHVDRSLVASLGAVHRLGGSVALVASLARGFRSPNLVERFFSGPTPGGEGAWVRNPDLAAETSVSADLGVRLRTGGVEAELFGYRTSLRDGIRLEPTGREIEGVVEYRNENVDELVVRGLEAWAAWAPLPALSLVAAADLQDRVNPGDPDDPLTDGVRTRVTGTARAVALPSRLSFTWEAAWHGAHRETLGDDPGPAGLRVPAYHVHDVRAFFTLAEGRHLTVGVENVFDRLHARTSNTGFFRPEPGRALVVALAFAF